MSRSVLVDTTRCIGCRACQVACKQENELPAEKTEFFAKEGGYQNPGALSANTFSLVTFFETMKEGHLKWVFAKRQCMHCLEPSCVSACIVGALKKTESGAVVYDESRCIGCRYCMVACPFEVPTFEWSKLVPFIRKCTFCSSREANTAPPTELNGAPLDEAATARHMATQTQPACSKVCPTGAIRFGERSDLLAEARKRINGAPDKYQDHIYGEKEAGGTSWLYLSAVPFETLDFPTNLGNRPYPSYTRSAMDAVPAVVLGAGALLGGAFWFSKRRAAVEDAERKEG